jgi:hypothetical protein
VKIKKQKSLMPEKKMKKAFFNGFNGEIKIADGNLI